MADKPQPKGEPMPNPRPPNPAAVGPATGRTDHPPLGVGQPRWPGHWAPIPKPK
jgi:hypothetical protein